MNWRKSRLTELAVFNALLYIRVGRLDEPADRFYVCGGSWFQLHMPHSLAGPLQQAGWIGQRCAQKEPDVDVRGEYIDVAEGNIAQTRNRTAVMHEFADLVPAFSHRLKPPMRDGSQFSSVLIKPRIDAGIALHDAVESQQFRFHRRFIFAFGTILRDARPGGVPAKSARNHARHDPPATARPHLCGN